MPRDLVTDPHVLRETLINAVARPPFVFCAALPGEGTDSFVLEVNQKRLWLPPEMWRDVVGGGINRMTSDVEVTVQDWEHPNGGRIVLFYVVVNQTYAVALRAYPNGEVLMPRLENSAFRRTRATALDVAHQLVGLPAQFPT
jgi:hypothetical protein